MEARNRLQYTALGDILNTCSRLEGLNKAIGSRVCVSREVVEKCRRCRFRPVGEFIVMGRHESTAVFAPVDPNRDPPEALQGYASAYEALTADPARAVAEFAELRQRYPQDACIAFHHNRLSRGNSGKLIEMRRK